MRPTAVAIMVLSSIFVSRSFADEAAGANPRLINVSGESVVYVVPDQAVVSFGIETFNENLDKAKAANDEAGTRLVKAIKAIGVEPRKIQTDTLQIAIEYPSGHAWEGIRGYFARRAYSVTLKDIKQFDALIDTGLKNGANQLMGFEFRTTELRKYRDQARAAAIKAAREKANDLAGGLQCAVGKPRTINEGSVSYYGGYNRWGMQFQQMAQNSVQFAPGGGGAADEPEDLPLGQIGVRAQVSVTFDLVPN